MEWNGIDCGFNFETCPLFREELQQVVGFLEELSDFEAEEWRRILLRRIALTLQQTIKGA